MHCLGGNAEACFRARGQNIAAVVRSMYVRQTVVFVVVFALLLCFVEWPALWRGVVDLFLKALFALKAGNV